MRKLIALIILVVSIVFIGTKKAQASTGGEMLGTVNTGGSNLNVRSSSTTSSSIIGTLKDGSYITILSEATNFYKIKTASITGYAHKNYVNKVNAKEAVTLDNLNIRSAASLTSNVITTIPKGSNVFIINSSTYFSKVVVNNSTVGYAYNTYLKTISNGTYLNVVSFKQFDSRWKNEVIAGGQTMGQIGCLTTAFAMSESYRTGTTITPLQMKNKLRYTSSGAAYWPSNYKTSTTSDYLNLIATKIKAGVPVIVGAKNSKSSHFILVTGYNGQGLKTSNFTINDPGSSYRTSLNEFFAQYPTFYKLAYYIY